MRAGSARVDCAPKIAAEVVSRHSEGAAPVAAKGNSAEPLSPDAVSVRSVSGPGTYSVRTGVPGVPDAESAAGEVAFECDTDGGSLADFGVDDGDLTLVVFLDDAARER